MNRCEHGERITKFCVTQHCHHKEAAGCDYCIRKYHFHLTNTVLLSEADLEELIRKVAVPSDTKFKTRGLQEATIQYLRTLRNSFNTWMDQAEKSITERLAHPLLRVQGLLPTYSRLKYKEYRKLNSKDLRAFNEFVKSQSPEVIKREETVRYCKEVEWTNDMLSSIERVAAQLSRLPEVKEGEGSIVCPNKGKVNELLETIKRECHSRLKTQGNFVFLKPQTLKVDETSIMIKKPIIEEKKDKSLISNTPEHKKGISVLVETKKGTSSHQSDLGNDALPNITSEAKQIKVEKEKRLKRRRSSIDDKLDLKFGQAVDEKAKEFQEKKRKVMESWERRRSQQKNEKKEEEGKIPVPQSQIVGKKLGRRQQSKQKEEAKVESIKEDTNKTDSEQNMNDPMRAGMEFLQTAIQNILPPLPPTIGKNQDQEISSKVVKIPLVVKNEADEIQSPILKSRKKQSSTPSPFGIALNSASDSKPKDSVLEKTPEISLFNKEERVKTQQKEVQKSQSNSDNVIVLELNQKNSLLLFSEALRSETNKAVEMLKAALKYSPNNLSAAEYLSYLYLQSGKAKECLEVCQSILVKIEDTPEEFQLTLHLHNNRAAALNMLGRYSESIMILEKCLRTRRKHYFYKNLADAYFSLGIPEKAIMNYQKALKLDPEYDEAYYNLAVTQFMQEEYTSAFLNVREARRIDCSNQTYDELEREITKRKENLAV